MIAQKVEDLQKQIESFNGTTEEFRLKYISKKGSVSLLFEELKNVPVDQKKSMGKILNDLKQLAEGKFKTLNESQETSSSSKTDIDLTLPPIANKTGNLHPLTLTRLRIIEVFERLGFSVADGPEIEDDWHNFTALNLPEHHPARDMQDTFYVDSGMVLRTHTSPCQVRAMERFGAPLRVIAPGRCFRYETVDASHENTFFQVEGLLIDRGISIANLIAVMRNLLREVFRRDVKVRLRPGYFPFVEPGFELDMSCAICGGTGCPTCKRSGWVEILPCGMVHPNVLRFGKIDPDEFTGFAFGLGLTRLAMMKYGVADIRVLNSGDVRATVPPEKLGGPMISQAGVK
jgi:phenylalanyl-tRNA synthetase alpha chain